VQQHDQFELGMGLDGQRSIATMPQNGIALGW